MITTNVKSVSRCFLLLISISLITTFQKIYTVIYRINDLNYIQRKADSNRAYPQNVTRLDIPPPNHRKNLHDAMRLDIHQPVHGKNLLVIHIGPEKTGTTSIQDMLAHLDLTGILPKDNFYYLGKVNYIMGKRNRAWDRKDLINPLLWSGSKSWFDPARRENYEKIINGKRGFKKQFHNLHASQNHNVIMSAEELSAAINLKNTTFFETLKQMIPVDQYDIHFVMMYRRYFDRLLSFYHFENGPRFITEKKAIVWPGPSRGMRYDTFREFYLKMINPRPGPWEPHPNQATSLSIYNEFQHLSPKTWPINIVNMHHPGSSSNVVVDLLCGMGNVTANTCKYLQDSNSTDAIHNLSQSNVDQTKKTGDKYMLEYRLMAQYAKHMGSVHENTTRQLAELAFQDMFRKWKGGRQAKVYKEGDTVVSSWNGDQDMTIPFACLSRKEQSDFLTMSENIESNLLPVFYNSTYGKDSLRRRFRKKEADHAFCNIALDALFENDTYWVDFLDCLHKSALIEECL